MSRQISRDSARQHEAERNFVNGRFIAPLSDDVVAILNPATEAIAGHVHNASRDQALWPSSSRRRATSVARAARRRTRRARAVSRMRSPAVSRNRRRARDGESGKSVADAGNEAVYAAQITRYHAEWARRIEGEVIPSDTPDENLVLHREPIGVVACLIPFNLPDLHADAQDRAGADRG